MRGTAAAAAACRRLAHAFVIQLRLCTVGLMKLTQLHNTLLRAGMTTVSSGRPTPTLGSAASASTPSSASSPSSSSTAPSASPAATPGCQVRDMCIYGAPVAENTASRGRCPGPYFRQHGVVKPLACLSQALCMSSYGVHVIICHHMTLPTADPFFRLKVKNMHRCKHGSDSGEAVVCSVPAQD